MARYNNLLELDVDKLFEELKVEEIIDIEKSIDAEIERKRVDLRSMVGDRYQDVLAASDAIKNMKTISQHIVDNIENITQLCEELVVDKPLEERKQPLNIEKNDEERVIIVQIRLAILMNEQIWLALDNGDNLTAAQFYLLAQHIHMGLSLSKREYLDRLPLLAQIKSSLQELRTQVFDRIKQKLESVEINAEETSSNLNALLLLQNQSTSDLLDVFIEHRKTALNTVMSTIHASVRTQVSAMVRCLITTIHLLHDCFISYSNQKNGLIWQQLDQIVEDSSSPTICKINLPTTPLIAYIPAIIKEYRPKYKSTAPISKDSLQLEDWLKTTKESVKEGLQNSLKLMVNVKGLHIVREEALKIVLPEDWEKICSDSNLPPNFNVWYYFFQELITARANQLITKKISFNINELQSEITEILNKNTKSACTESDLRTYMWVEESGDISHVENEHTGLSMKTQGYSENVVSLCDKLNSKYLELLKDASQYLYGKEFDDRPNPNLLDSKNRKYVDKELLENHIRIESTNNSSLLTAFLQDYIQNEPRSDLLVLKALMCARFLQAIANLCPHFNKCCTLNGSLENWTKICGHLAQSSLQFWEYWVNKCVQTTEKEAKRQLNDIKICRMIAILPRWDTIEIQEQTEEKVFKSHIKVPSKPSLCLHTILSKLNEDLCQILPHTVPKQIHLQYIEKNADKIIQHYQQIDANALNQNQALQFLFDVKFLTIFCIPRENIHLISASQKVCDQFRARIDPFDLDVFYSHLQANVKRAAIQSQVILGCLLPSSGQLNNLGVPERIKEQDKEPSILALSVPSVTAWFPLLPISVPSQRTMNSNVQSPSTGQTAKSVKAAPKAQDPASSMRMGAAALFGGLTTDWFS